MRTLGVNGDPTVEVISAYAAAMAQIPVVPATPGWYVVGAFYLPISVRAKLEAIGLVSVAGSELHVRLVDAATATPVSGSDVTITSSTVDVRAVSGAVDLEGGKVYQFQAEAIGASGVGNMKAATLLNG